MLPSPMLAETDFGQVIFIIVFLVVGFIQWVMKVLKEKMEAANQNNRVPTPEELEARRQAWEEQTRQHTPPPTPSPSSTPPFGGSGGGLGELLGEFRKGMEEARKAAAPPPLPPQRSHQRVVEEKPQHRPLPPPAQATVAPPTVVPHNSIAGRKNPHPLTAILHTTQGYRQAFVLREVLGPPRGFQEYRGPED